MQRQRSNKSNHRRFPRRTHPRHDPHADLQPEIEWIANRWPWDWFVTLRFEFDVTNRQAARLFDVWASALATVAGVHLWYAIAWGPQPSGRWHFHVLLHDPSHALTADCIRGHWWWGDNKFKRDASQGAKVVAYNADDGGAAGYMMLRHAGMQMDCACPERRCRRGRGGCGVGPNTRWFRLFLDRPVPA